MRRIVHRWSAYSLVALCALCALCWSAAARAQQGSGFEAGFRLGYAFPLGKASGAANDDLSEGVAGAIPLWLDLGYRLNPNLFLGLYAHYAFGILGDAIDDVCGVSDQVDCSVSDIRIGLQVHYHIDPNVSANPWVGLGVGLEWLSTSIEGGGAEATVTAFGIELLNLQFGLDFAVAKNFYVGPFVSFSLGQYDNVSFDCSGVACDAGFGVDGDIDDKALHEWLLLGVRGAYAP